MTEVHEKPKRLNTVISIISFIFSIVALILTIVFNITSNTIAKNALDAANNANDISLGKNQIYPMMTIIDIPKDEINLTTRDNIENSSIYAIIDNSGEVPIDQISIHIIGLSGLLYSSEKPDMKYDDFKYSKNVVDFNEQLAPNGFVNIDIKVFILTYLAALPDLNPSISYHCVLNMIILPRKIGELLPVKYPGTVKDSGLIKILFIPQIIKQQVSLFPENNPIDIRIFNYSSEP